MPPTKTNIFINSRLIAMLALGFSSGLPFALTSSTLQTWFTDANVSLIIIGSLSLLGIPYTLKFLWAPLMDYYGFNRLGKRQGWILLTQLGLAITLFSLARMDPVSQTTSMCIIALLVAFFSASQDVAVDAYRTDILAPEERGLGSAYFVFAYRVAALLSGGFALVCADYFGWQVTYNLMAVLLLLCMIPAYKAPHAVEYAPAASSLFRSILAGILDLMQRDRILLLVLFVIFYKFGTALAMSLMSNFLLHGLGFSKTEIGLAYKVVSFIATVLGALVGGALLIRWQVYRALLVFGLAQAFSNLTFVALAMAGKQFWLMTVSIFVENFCTGLSTAAFLAFLMSLCNHRYSASQFALLSAIDSLGRVLLGPAAALIVEGVGWVQFYFWSFVLCFPGIIFLLLLKEKVSYAHAAAD
ncbi:AmpG family muropeptide MFS transporter [Aquicella lusitana]|uniref:PAT family beta-lactamase induction signal transducer AmpG n=1 Tax=Aquicella lusitana TaxID=254246 RepID=A0A370GYP0_9COXI|nr:MFS transporter [Aquicella lusitana]RDI48773.1 PAT family beta-lactamase induction signal transducer AmpG [Aquicella lusitana]VVC73201.1 hypothetical protein AQULUS_09330 [Aquicella lusitana]